MTTNRKVPQIRFNGFSDNWIESKLGNIGSVEMNKRIFKYQTHEKGDIPFYKIGTFGHKPNAFISRKLFEEYKEKYSYPKKGDILISASGSIGKIVIYKGKDEYFQDSNIVWLKHDRNILNSFLQQFYLVVKWHGLEGGTIKRLYNKNILDTNIFLPNKDEQTKIGNYFQNLDKLIEKKEKKHQKYKQLKKAMLEKMFPKDAEVTPEIRFKGFSEEWEEKKLDDVIDIIDGDRGHNYPKENEFTNQGDILFLSASNVTKNGFKFEKEQYITLEKSNSMGNGKVLLNDIILTSRGSIGNITWYSEDIYKQFKLIRINSGMLILRVKNNITPSFATYFLKSPLGEKQINLISFGSAQPQLTKKDISNYLINISSNKLEQIKIGNYFQKLDKLIDLQLQELKKLKNIKKASLDKMFV